MKNYVLKFLGQLVPWERGAEVMAKKLPQNGFLQHFRSFDFDETLQNGVRSRRTELYQFSSQPNY